MAFSLRAALRRIALGPLSFAVAAFVAWGTRRVDVHLARGDCPNCPPLNPKVLVGYATSRLHRESR